MRYALAGLLLALVHTPVTAGPMEKESLLQGIPQGFVIGRSSDDGRDAITEFVPRGETTGSWSRMLTVQILRGSGDVTPTQLHAMMAKAWLQSCPEGRVMDMIGVTENGYPVGLWAQSCPLSAGSSKPVHAWLKVIQGNDSVYVLRSAMRAEPTDAEIDEQVGWLRQSMVCDARRPEQSCPTHALQPVTPAEQEALDGRSVN